MYEVFFIHLIKNSFMDDSKISDKLNELLGNFSGGFSFLEEAIPVELQMEYFEFRSNLSNKNKEKKNVLNFVNKLYDKNYPIEDKKLLLTRIASLEDVEAFKILRDFSGKKYEKLYFWSVLALQDCKMSLESDLLDENQVFISTGLGGKGTSLRYFVVLFPIINESFTNKQQKIVESEFNFSMNKNNSIIEKVDLSDKYISFVGLIPYKLSIRNMFDEAIKHCNDLGNFLDPEIIITNIKIYSEHQILEFYQKRKRKKP